MNESKLREQICLHGKSLFDRGLTVGSSGNLSVRLDDGWLITPTNSCLGRLDPARISKIDDTGRLLTGDKASKEAFLHLSMYGERPTSNAVVHLHSTYSVAVSVLSDVDPDQPIPPITAYYVMKVGKVILLPYYAPGDLSLAEAVKEVARNHHTVLLANHGPVVAGGNLETAVYAAEELEETAKLFIILRSEKLRPLTPRQILELGERFPS